MKRSMAIAVSLLLGTSAYAENGDIIRDGEYLFLEAQHGEAWAVQDKNIDAKLAEIRDANGGKPPNIVYVLIDDVSFGGLVHRFRT